MSIEVEKDHGHSGSKLGWFLCWAVVFADIGTSLYYVPGILYGEVGRLTGLFVLMSFIVFILLVLKYIDITDRYADGGGVVAVASEAFHPWVGAFGGMFITVSYYLTASISSVSGFAYLNSAIDLGPYVVTFAALSILLLGILNYIGISESAKVTAYVAVSALIVDVVLVFAIASQIGSEGWSTIFKSLSSVSGTSFPALLAGFAGSFLAFSGLESISQLSPAMQTPRKKIAGISMLFVVVTILITSPLLTLFSTNLLSAKIPGTEEEILKSINLKHERLADISLLNTANNESSKINALSELENKYNSQIENDSENIYYYSDSIRILEDDNLSINEKEEKLSLHLEEQVHLATEYSERFLSELGAQYAGPFIKIAVVATATILLIFASNTAIIGSYHVFIALTREHFMPKFLTNRNSKFGTPHWAIFFATFPPIVVVFITNGNLSLLGELYAFGLLGAFTLTSIGLDVIRFKENRKFNFSFFLGIFTSLSVLIAWCTNLVNKPRATAFGLSVSAIGLIVAYFVRKNAKSNPSLKVKESKSMVTKIEKAVPNILVPVYEEYDPSFIKFVAEYSMKNRLPVVLLYIREFYDVLSTTSESFETDSEAMDFVKKSEKIFAKLGVNFSTIYQSTSDLAKTINEYRDDLNPEITILSPHKTSALLDFLHGDVIKHIITYPSGNILIYTGNNKS